MAKDGSGNTDVSWLRIVKTLMVEAYKATKYGSYYVLIAGFAFLCRVSVVRTPNGTLPNEIVRIAGAFGFVLCIALFFALLVWDFTERIGWLTVRSVGSDPVLQDTPPPRKRGAAKNPSK